MKKKKQPPQPKTDNLQYDIFIFRFTGRYALTDVSRVKFNAGIYFSANSRILPHSKIREVLWKFKVFKRYRPVDQQNPFTVLQSV